MYFIAPFFLSFPLCRFSLLSLCFVCLSFLSLYGQSKSQSTGERREEKNKMRRSEARKKSLDTHFRGYKNRKSFSSFISRVKLDRKLNEEEAKFLVQLSICHSTSCGWKKKLRLRFFIFIVLTQSAKLDLNTWELFFPLKLSSSGCC